MLTTKFVINIDWNNTSSYTPSNMYTVLESTDSQFPDIVIAWPFILPRDWTKWLLESSSSDSATSSKRRMLLAKRVDKWIVEHDEELSTVTWLKYTVVDCPHVDTLTCLYSFQK